jgi:hypothetical protein
MDLETNIIYNILLCAEDTLTAADISTLIYKRHNKRISKTIVKNYLWSYFRDLIYYNPTDFSYKLKKEPHFFKITNDIQFTDSPRMISVRALGDKMEVTISNDLNLEKLVNAIATFYLNEDSTGKKKDLIKKLNQILHSNI